MLVTRIVLQVKPPESPDAAAAAGAVPYARRAPAVTVPALPTGCVAGGQAGVRGGDHASRSQAPHSKAIISWIFGHDATQEDDRRDRHVATAPAGDFASKWEAQLARLAAYKAEHGDCKVRVRGGRAEDSRLGNWVSNQRRGKRTLDRGEPSRGMTAERVARLTALGFAWDPQKCSSKPSEARSAPVMQ